MNRSHSAEVTIVHESSSYSGNISIYELNCVSVEGLSLSSLASQILWILPTFIGKVPVPDSRFDSLVNNNLDFEKLNDPADDR